MTRKDLIVTAGAAALWLGIAPSALAAEKNAQAPRTAYSTDAPAGVPAAPVAEPAAPLPEADAAPARRGTYGEQTLEPRPQPEALLVRPQGVTPGSTDYSIYDAGVRLLNDDDHDGFYHRFELSFDADTRYFTTQVYARLYLSHAGGPWNLYHTTDRFRIDGSAIDDALHVTTTLTSGYPPGYYDLAIDLYEAGSNQLVASYDSYADPDLGALPLEDFGEEAFLDTLGVFAGVVLLADDDLDGYFHRFAVDLDVDAPHQSRRVYAVLDARRAGGSWLHEHTTSVFTVDGTGAHDLLRIHGDWQTGYPAGAYDLRIRVYAADSDALLAELGPASPLLAGLPLEDAASDGGRVAPPGQPGPGHDDPVGPGEERTGAMSLEVGGSAGGPATLALLITALGAGRLTRRRATRA